MSQYEVRSVKCEVPARRQCPLAQIRNLLSRRFSICRALDTFSREKVNHQPNAIRRYDRVQLCATNWL